MSASALTAPTLMAAGDGFRCAYDDPTSVAANVMRWGRNAATQGQPLSDSSAAARQNKPAAAMSSSSSSLASSAALPSCV